MDDRRAAIQRARRRFMDWWWSFDKPLRLQNSVGWLWCQLAGHEDTPRYRYCGWCGADRKEDRSR